MMRRLARPFAGIGLVVTILAVIGTVVVRVVAPAPFIATSFGFGPTVMLAFLVMGLTWATIGAFLVVRRPGADDISCDARFAAVTAVRGSVKMRHWIPKGSFISLRRIFRPQVFRISAHQFLPYLWVKPLPEAGQVGGGLHGTLVGSQ